MAVLDQDELIELTQNLMGGSVEKVSTAGYEQAASQTQKELGLSFPISNDTISYWSVERMRRHVIYILMVESAHKFQYKQIHLEHRFNHYIKLVEKMDKDWLEAIEDNPELFDQSTYEEFCHYLAPGFVYDALGRDLSYM